MDQAVGKMYLSNSTSCNLPRKLVCKLLRAGSRDICMETDNVLIHLVQVPSQHPIHQMSVKLEVTQFFVQKWTQELRKINGCLLLMTVFSPFL